MNKHLRICTNSIYTHTYAHSHTHTHKSHTQLNKYSAILLCHNLVYSLLFLVRNERKKKRCFSFSLSFALFLFFRKKKGSCAISRPSNVILNFAYRTKKNVQFLLQLNIFLILILVNKCNHYPRSREEEEKNY